MYSMFISAIIDLFINQCADVRTSILILQKG